MDRFLRSFLHQMANGCSPQAMTQKSEFGKLSNPTRRVQLFRQWQRSTGRATWPGSVIRPGESRMARSIANRSLKSRVELGQLQLPRSRKLAAGKNSRGWRVCREVVAVSRELHRACVDVGYDFASALLDDPLGFDAGDSNLYRYVNNAPTNHTDPSGEAMSPTSRQGNVEGPLRPPVIARPRPFPPIARYLYRDPWVQQARGSFKGMVVATITAGIVDIDKRTIRIT